MVLANCQLVVDNPVYLPNFSVNFLWLDFSAHKPNQRRLGDESELFWGVHPWFLLRCPTHNCTLDIFGCSLRAVLDMCFFQPHLSLDPYRVTDSKDPWWSLWMISFLHVCIHVYTAIHTAFSGNIRHVHNFHTGVSKNGGSPKPWGFTAKMVNDWIWGNPHFTPADNRTKSLAFPWDPGRIPHPLHLAAWEAKIIWAIWPYEYGSQLGTPKTLK
jgi:hypothetical protein